MKSNKPFSLSERINSFKYAFNGLRLLFKTEHNAWIHLVVTAIVVVIGMENNLNNREWMWIALAIGLVFMAELFNSAIEYLANAITEDQNEKIKKAKDLGAGATLIAAITAVVIGTFIFWPHIF